MSRRAARFTQADVVRAIRAANALGAGTIIEIPKDGTFRIIPKDGAETTLPAANKEKPQGFVYFIKRGVRRGPIKIGFSAKPKKRLAQLQTSHPDQLILLGTVPGTPSLEQEIHQRFKHIRLGGEWFSPTAELTDFILQVRK